MCHYVQLKNTAFTRGVHRHKHAAKASGAGWIPCAHIRTTEVHPALIVEAERAYITIAIQHVLILLLTTLKPAIKSHTDACLLQAQTVCNSCQASTHSFGNSITAAGQDHGKHGWKFSTWEWLVRFSNLPGPLRKRVPLRVSGTTPSTSVTQ